MFHILWVVVRMGSRVHDNEFVAVQDVKLYVGVQVQFYWFSMSAVDDELVRPTLRPLYAKGNDSWCPLNGRIRGTLSRSACFGEEKNMFLVPRIKALFRRLSSHAVVTTQTRLSGLLQVDVSLNFEE